MLNKIFTALAVPPSVKHKDKQKRINTFSCLIVFIRVNKP
jgi:hypothetical protein